MRRTALFSALAIAFGLAVATAPAASATADVTVTLPMTSFRDIVVDVPHGHVYLSGGGSTGIVVRDLNAAEVTTILDQPGADGMALSPDGSRLYVALGNGDAISAIDTTTLTEVTRYSTGVDTCPASVAPIGTSIWFGYSCTNWGGDIGVLDLSGETPVVTLARTPEGVYREGAPRVKITPDGSHLLSATYYAYPSSLYSMTVSGSTLTLGASRQVGSGLRDFAISGDGTRVVTASAAPYNHPRFLVDTLASDGVFGNQYSYPVAAAMSGSYVAAGTDAYYDKDVRVYRGDGLLLRDFELGHVLQNQGLAFTPDGSTLYAVSGDSYNGNPRYLHVLHDATKLATSITLTAPATPQINTQYTVGGSIGSAVGAGATIHVTRSSTYGVVPLPDVTTTTGGAFSVNDTVAKRGTYTYTATYDGGTDYAGTSKALSFAVKGLTPSLYLSANAAAYPFHATATFTGRLGGTSTSRALRLSVTPYGYGTTVLKTANVDGNGYLSASYTITRRTTFTASFLGDDVYEPRSISIVRSSYVSLSQSLAGYYATSGSYRVYHRTVNPVLNDYVSPNRYGACMSYEAQQYYSGTWRTVATNSCIRLNSSSRVAAVFTTSASSHPIGTYRMRSTFNGDTSNLRTTGGWLYLKFTT